jgi:hypothetical protein
LGTGRRRRWLRTRVLDRNPFQWLTARDRLPQFLTGLVYLVVFPLWLWVFVKAMSLLLGTASFMALRMLQPLLMMSCVVNLVLKFMIASEASRRLNDDRQSGALELLLVTPLKIRSIVSGQRRALLRQFVFALGFSILLMAAPWYAFAHFSPPNNSDDDFFAIMVVGNIVSLVSDFVALGWVGMWDGLRARQHHRAILRTLIKILVVPWIIFLLMQTMMLSGARSAGEAKAIFMVWFGLGVVNNLFWAARARRGLSKYFRLIASDAAKGKSRLRPPRFVASHP